jgi:hypothetical protein
MALISRFPGALQLGAFQSGAFQVDLARVDAAGDIATASEIAYLERRRRVDAYLAERQNRADLRRLRALDKQIDQYLRTRDGAEGEVDESDLSPNARALLKDAVSSVRPQTTIKGAGRAELKQLKKPLPSRPSELGRQMARAKTPPPAPVLASPDVTFFLDRAKGLDAAAQAHKDAALRQLMSFPTAPARGLTQAQMARLFSDEINDLL